MFGVISKDKYNELLKNYELLEDRYNSLRYNYNQVCKERNVITIMAVVMVVKLWEVL